MPHRGFCLRLCLHPIEKKYCDSVAIESVPFKPFRIPNFNLPLNFNETDSQHCHMPLCE